MSTRARKKAAPKKAAPTKSAASPAKQSTRPTGPALNVHGEPVPQSTINFDTIEKD